VVVEELRHEVDVDRVLSLELVAQGCQRAKRGGLGSAKSVGKRKKMAFVLRAALHVLGPIFPEFV
jgi:hypothetical protein